MLRRLEKRVLIYNIREYGFDTLIFIQILVPLPEKLAREAMLRKYLPEDKAENLEYEALAELLEVIYNINMNLSI